MGEITRLRDEGFDAWTSGDIPTLVDFYADWCGPCQRIAPFLDRLAKEQDGRLRVAAVDVDQAPALAERFAVITAPTLLMFVQGKMIARLDGVEDAGSIRAFIEQVLSRIEE